MKLHRKIKQRIALRLMMVAGITAVVVLTALITMVVIHLGDTGSTRASESGFESGVSGFDINNGEILSKFDWDQQPPTTASIGPNAIAVGKSVSCTTGGRSSTFAL